MGPVHGAVCISNHRIIKIIAKKNQWCRFKWPTITKNKWTKSQDGSGWPTITQTHTHHAYTHGALPSFQPIFAFAPIYTAKNTLRVHCVLYSPCSYQYPVCVEINVYLEKYNLLTIRLPLCVESIFISISRAASGYSYGAACLIFIL